MGRARQASFESFPLYRVYNSFSPFVRSYLSLLFFIPIHTYVYLRRPDSYWSYNSNGIWIIASCLCQEIRNYVHLRQLLWKGQRVHLEPLILARSCKVLPVEVLVNRVRANVTRSFLSSGSGMNSSKQRATGNEKQRTLHLVHIYQA